ncbi:MAG: radical SAM protein [Candidatus Methanomethylicia archaeon]|nr:radical SAM protein [Candidatus Methanomethylicia archaeon]
MIEYIRVSIGTASQLNLFKIKLAAEPTTAYLMNFVNGKCYADCAFCTQAKSSTSSQEYLSRVNWPKFKFRDVLETLKLNRSFKRVCIQTLFYPNYVEDTLEIVSKIREVTDLPISVSIHPINIDDIKLLKNFGVERIGIGVDAASKRIFDQVKKFFSWNRTIDLIFKAREIFGWNMISAHLIYGLGDSDYEFIEAICKFYHGGINVGLFTFTPINGTLMEKYDRPNISSYRSIQLAHYLIKNKLAKIDDFLFDSNGKLLKILIDKTKLLKVIESGEPFKTTGCPDCNRPFYNESPGEDLYNYPETNMVIRDLEKIKMQLKHLLN